MKDLDTILKEAQFFVEVSSFEKNSLYWKYKEKLNWENDGYGFAYTVGHITSNRKKLPVVVYFSCATINDKRICFYEAISRGVDWTMIEKFLLKNFPIKYDKGTRSAMETAGNFHNVYHFCLEK